MATNQEIPERPQEKSEWTFRRVFPFAAVANSISKTIISVFDVILVASVAGLITCEVLDKNVSWLFYILTILTLFIAFVERRAIALNEKKDKK